MAPQKSASSKKLASPRRVVISEEEFATDTTSLENVQTGVWEFQTHGFVLLENAIDHGVVEKLSNQMRADAATCLTFPDLVFNHGDEQNNFSITPPLSNEYMFESVWANRHATAIMQQIIGPRPLLCWASSNVAVQSGPSARQAVHSDAYADILNFPFCVEMNIYLQDTTPNNGSTELWPGTHVFTEDDHLPTGRGFIKKKAFTDRARTSPPIQPIISAGSILMRDLRLWHSGMPNTTATPRVIAALLYFPQWFRPLMRLTLPETVRPKAEAWTHIDLLSNTDFVEGPVDHLRMHFPMNFTQDPAKAMVQYRRAKDNEQGRALGAVIPVTNDNYWTPSKYQTRAAVNKRKREAEDDGEEDQKRQQKQEQTKSEADDISKAESQAPKLPEIKQEVETEKEPAVSEQEKVSKLPESMQGLETENEPAVAEHEEAAHPATEVSQELEAEQKPELDVARRPWLTSEKGTIHKKQELYGNSIDADDELPEDELPGDRSSDDSCSDQSYSPGYPAEWMEKMKGDQDAAEGEDEWNANSADCEVPGHPEYSEYFPKDQPKAHNAEPKSDTEQLEDLTDYEDSPVDGGFSDSREENVATLARRQEQVAARERAILATQRKTFKPGYVPGNKFGPGISPLFSPKSKSESPRKPPRSQEVRLEKEMHEKQVQENLSKQQAAPMAKMVESPKQRQTSPPPRLTEAQASWERDPRPYKGPRPGTPKYPASISPFQSPPPPPPSPPHPSPSQIPHVSPYCAASTCTVTVATAAVAPLSPSLEYSPTKPALLLRPPPPPPPLAPPSPSSPPSLPLLPSPPPPSAQPKATDAYDAYTQAQLLETQAQQLRMAELRRARDERNSSRGGRGGERGGGRAEGQGEGEGDGGVEWLSVEDTQESEWGW